LTPVDLGNKIPTLLRAQLEVYIYMAREASVILSHWHKLFEGFQESPVRIYSLLDEAIDKRKIPGVKISWITFPEGGPFSARRLYCRVRRREHIFDICAAPFGTSFFVSWWLGEKPRLHWLITLLLVILFFPFSLIVLLGIWLYRRETYYRLDTALMFQDSVHSAVLEIVELVTIGTGVRGLTELEKKPIMSDLFKRRAV
jgi:hypothetical protein